jgi:hypothetical protein
MQKVITNIFSIYNRAHKTHLQFGCGLYKQSQEPEHTHIFNFSKEKKNSNFLKYIRFVERLCTKIGMH